MYNQDMKQSSPPKLLALDIDGTLVKEHTNEISPVVKAALRKAQRVPDPGAPPKHHMEKIKVFYSVKFSASTIKAAYDELLKVDRHRGQFAQLIIGFENEDWSYDSIGEFYAEIDTSSNYDFDVILQNNSRLIVSHTPGQSRVVVRAETRAVIQTIFNIFEQKLEN